MKSKKDNVLLSITAVSDALEKSETWVRRCMLRAPDRIPPFMKLDGKLRFIVPDGDVRAWEAARIARITAATVSRAAAS